MELKVPTCSQRGFSVNRGPNSYLYKRGLCVHYTVILETHNLVKMCKEAGEKGFTHLIVVGEHDKKVNS